ncbi:hypothetical protein [Lactococcus lactis]
MLRYEPENIMNALLKNFNSDDALPFYVSQFSIPLKNETLGEQMFEVKGYDKEGIEIGSCNAKESFLRYFSLSNQLIDVTLKRETELKEALKEYGNFSAEDDSLFEMNLNHSIENELGMIDIFPEANGSYILEKTRVSFYVSEYRKIEKLFSIFYGSVFSLKFNRVFVKWVRYEVTISSLKVADLSELKETLRTLSILLEKVDHQVNLD